MTGAQRLGWGGAQRRARPDRHDRGSGTVLVLTVVMILAAVLAALALLGGAIGARQRAATAADLGALAAAGALPPSCAVAAGVVADNGARLVSCTLAGSSAAVVVAWFGRGWVAELAAVLPGGRDAVGWCGVAALCVLGNWGCAALRRWFERGSHAAA